MKHFASRLADIQPFHVMDVLARARALEREGRSIIHLEIGEPDFPTAQAIVEAGIHALEQGQTHYTPALGLFELRAAIAASYHLPSPLQPERVIVTPGASGALQLIFAALVNPGDQVLMTDPGYPCNRHFVRMFEGEAVTIPVDAKTHYQLNADLIRKHWGPRTVAVLLASPSNPTGTLISENELARIIQTVGELGGVLIVDEIYHGLTYDLDVKSALNHSTDLFVVNSFSKYYGMTGWRIGWLIAPSVYVPAIDKLAQNIFIAASTPAQHAALAAFQPEVKQELERRCDIFRQRRDFLLPALRQLGFNIPLTPAGAFYLYADCQSFTSNSEELALKLLDRVGVAVTPGLDFGDYHAERHVRFSYANTLENLKEAVKRLADYLSAGK